MRALLLCASLLLLVSHAPLSESAAVMSVDLGSEWFKVAVVSPGVPMEIALNVESKRKTGTVVSIRDGQRTFGSEAMNNCVRFPKSCYVYFLDLLGKSIHSPSVKEFSSKFPYYDIVEDPSTGGIRFQHAQDEFYSPEELLSMVLTHAKSIAESYTGQRIKDVVYTVPIFFNEAERRSVLRASAMANLDCLQLISEPMAVALNYGMFRRKEVNATAKNIIFYDMGASDTTVAVVAFQTIKTKERGFSETHPMAQILGAAYDRTLGGLDLQLKLRDLLAQKFNDLKKTKTDVRTVSRAMGKLFKESGRAKNVLSANTNLFAQVENVMEDIDFKVPLSRREFYELIPDFFERAMGVFDAALKNAGDMKMEEISEVIIVGAGTRVPKLQESLSKKIGFEVSKNMNTDESAAMGAVYKAADLSNGFKVKKFITKEAVLFPIDVDFKRDFLDDEEKPAVKHVKRSLFGKSNSYPQKKIMTFNKFDDDFTFNVNINGLDYLGQEEVKRISNLNLTEVTVKGVKAALENNTGDNIESKGVKAHFQLDESGFLSISSVEAAFEKTISVEEQEAEEKKKEEEAGGSKNDTEAAGPSDAWSKIGDTFSSLFGDKTKTEEAPKEDEDSSKDKKKDDSTTEGKKNETKKKKKKAKAEPKKPKVVSLKETLAFEVKDVNGPPISEEALKASLEKLRALDKKDEERRLREDAQNALESFVIDTRDKLYQEVFEKSATEEEREKIGAKLSEVSDWIDEEVGPFTETELMRAKLTELTEMTSSLFARVREHTERPEAFDLLKNMLNSTQYFLAKARNSSHWFKDNELEHFEKKINETREWKEHVEKELSEQPMTEMPLTTISMINEKSANLDREVKYLVNKAKIAKATEEAERVKKAKEQASKKKKKDKKKANETEKEEPEQDKAESETTPDPDVSEKKTEEKEEGEEELAPESSGDVELEGNEEEIGEKEEESTHPKRKEEEDSSEEEEEPPKEEL